MPIQPRRRFIWDNPSFNLKERAREATRAALFLPETSDEYKSAYTFLTTAEHTDRHGKYIIYNPSTHEWRTGAVTNGIFNDGEREWLERQGVIQPQQHNWVTFQKDRAFDREANAFESLNDFKAAISDSGIEQERFRVSNGLSYSEARKWEVRSGDNQDPNLHPSNSKRLLDDFKRTGFTNRQPLPGAGDPSDEGIGFTDAEDVQNQQRVPGRQGPQGPLGPTGPDDRLLDDDSENENSGSRSTEQTGPQRWVPTDKNPFSSPAANALWNQLLESSIGTGAAVEGLASVQDLLLSPNYDDVRKDLVADREDAQKHEIALQNLISGTQQNVANTQAGRYDRQGQVDALGRFTPTGSIQETDLNRYSAELIARIQSGLTPHEEGTEVQADRDLQQALAQFGIGNQYGFAESLSQEGLGSQGYRDLIGAFRSILTNEATQGTATSAEDARSLIDQRLATEASGGLLGYNDDGTSETLRQHVLDQVVAQASGGLINQQEIARQQTLRNTGNAYSFVGQFINPSQLPQGGSEAANRGNIGASGQGPIGPQGQQGLTEPPHEWYGLQGPDGLWYPFDDYTDSWEWQTGNQRTPPSETGQFTGGDFPDPRTNQAQLGPEAPIGPNNGQTSELARALQALTATQLAASAPDIRQQDINLLSNPTALGALAAVTNGNVGGFLGGTGGAGSLFGSGFGGVGAGTGTVEDGQNLAANSDTDALLMRIINDGGLAFDGTNVQPSGPFRNFGLGNFNDLSASQQEFGVGQHAARGQGPADLFKALSSRTPSGRDNIQRSTFSTQTRDRGR